MHLPFVELLLQEKELSLEDQVAEKLRVQKLQEEADLELAKDAFGKTGSRSKEINTIKSSFSHTHYTTAIVQSHCVLMI